jgi:hypothetical protein
VPVEASSPPAGAELELELQAKQTAAAVIPTAARASCLFKVRKKNGYATGLPCEPSDYWQAALPAGK